MRAAVALSCIALLTCFDESAEPGAREALIKARTQAYDANFRNDQVGLRESIAVFERLQNDADVGAMALYYLSWAEWSLSGSEFQASETAAAIASVEAAVRHARLAATRQPDLADFQGMLANALISLAVLDRRQLPTLSKELSEGRRKALELGPDNPRVVLMDAGFIFWNPPELGGGQEKGIARWQKAMRLFEEEAQRKNRDPLMPDWGRALAYGWVCPWFLAMNPPRIEDAQRAADTALALRPDFWWVKEMVVPRFKTRKEPFEPRGIFDGTD